MVKPLLRVVASVLSVVFLFTNSCFALPTAIEKSPVQENNYEHIISKQYGNVMSSSLDGSDGLVFFIEDAHTSLEAQYSIAAIINELQGNFNAPLVCFEGYSGTLGEKIDRAFKRSEEREDINKKIADFLMSNGEMTGTQYAYLFREHPSELIGVEKQEDYLQNLKQFETALKANESLIEELSHIEKLIAYLSNVLYPKSIQMLEEKEKYFEAGADCSQCVALLIGLAEEYNVSLEQYPSIALIATADENVDISALNVFELLGEIKALSVVIKKTILEGDGKQLAEISTRIEQLSKLLSLTMARSDFDTFYKYKKEFFIQLQFDFEWLQANAVRYNYEFKTGIPEDMFLKAIENTKEFYRVASVRDKNLVQNTWAQMAKHNAQAAILVAGGFHKEGVLYHLKERNLSYIDITPMITTLEEKLKDIYYMKGAGIEGGLIPNLLSFMASTIALTNLFTDTDRDGLEGAFIDILGKILEGNLDGIDGARQGLIDLRNSKGKKDFFHYRIDERDGYRMLTLKNPRNGLGMTVRVAADGKIETEEFSFNQKEINALRFRPADEIEVIVSENKQPLDILASVDDELHHPALISAKHQLMNIIQGAATTDLSTVVKQIDAFNAQLHAQESQYKGIQKDYFNLIMIAKSLFCRELAERFLSADASDDLNALMSLALDQNLSAYVDELVANGDLSADDGKKQLEKTRKFIRDEFLTLEKMPAYIKQGIIRGMLEGRYDDLLFAFGKGWREFGTAGIRNKGPSSAFEAVQILELYEFAEGSKAPILVGPNTINLITLLQQTATVKMIVPALQAYVAKNPEALEVSVKELLENSALADRMGDVADVMIELTPELKDDIKRGQVTIAYDSRLNGEEFAHLLAADMLEAGIKVQLFDNVAGMPALTYASKMEGSLFGFLISASHSEPNFNGFKFVVGSKMSQVDKPFQQMIMAFRNLVDYSDINLELAQSSFDKEARNEHLASYAAQGQIEWLGTGKAREDFDYFGLSPADFYTDYYDHVEARSIMSDLGLSDAEAEEIRQLKEAYDMGYVAFSGAGCNDAGDFVGFMEAMGYKNVSIIKSQTEHVDGRFKSFIRGWKLGMPDPGNPAACAVAFLDFLVQEGGDVLDNIDAAIDSWNKKDCFVATDPDIDRASMTIKLPAGVQGNVKALIIEQVREYLEFKGMSKADVKAKLAVLEDKLEDKLLLTANDAWLFLVYNKLKLMQQQGALKKDKIYVNIKSHVTTDGMNDLAEQFQKEGYHVYTVDTFVGFTLLAERANQMFNFARNAWAAKLLLEHQAGSVDLKQILGVLEEEYAPIAGMVSALDDVMVQLRKAAAKGDISDDERTQLLEGLSLAANIEVLCGVEESNGYGEFGRTACSDTDAETIAQIMQEYADAPMRHIMNVIFNQTTTIENEHIREKDGSLAAYLFTELAIMLKRNGIELYDSYMDMWKYLGTMTGTENLWTRYPGAKGAGLKVENIQAIEKDLAFVVQKLQDTDEEVFFNGADGRQYKVVGEGAHVFWGAKYDNNFLRFPEEGIRFFLEREYNGVTYRIWPTFRPSGTGMENRDYNWIIAVMGDADPEQVRADLVVVQNDMRLDFFGDESVGEGYFTMFQDGEWPGLLLTMKEAGARNFHEIFSRLLGKDSLQLTDLELQLLDNTKKFASKSYVPKGRMDDDDWTTYYAELDEERGVNRALWDTYFKSDEPAAYSTVVSFVANGEEVLVNIPKAMAVSWSASLADYIVSLLEAKGVDQITWIDCDISDLAQLVAMQIASVHKKNVSVGEKITTVDPDIDRAAGEINGEGTEARAGFKTDYNPAVAALANRLKDEKFEERLQALYGALDRTEAEALDEKLSTLGFDGTSNRLGWTLPNFDWIAEHPETVEQVLADGETIRDNYKYVIFCGMGGSGLSVQTVKDTFGEKETKIYSLRTTDPQVIKAILDEIAELEGSLEAALKQTLVIPVSKSGTTKETVSHKEYFEQLFALFNIDIVKDANGKAHMWVVTDSGSPLDTGDFEQRTIQLNELGDIGGRFTAPTTNVFLLPSAIVAPERVKPILDIAKRMNELDSVTQDAFLQLAAFLYHMSAVEGKDKVTLIVPSVLKSFPLWLEQLVEESLGKDGKGITIFYDEDLSPEVLKSAEDTDEVYVRISVGDDKPQADLWSALAAGNYATFDIILPSVDAIGGLMLGWQRTVAAIAYLWDICFVNQPGVEGYKNATREVMDALEEGERVTVPGKWVEKTATYNSVKLFYAPLIEAGAFTEGELAEQVTTIGGTMDNAAAVYAAILLLLQTKPGFEAAEIMSYGKMTGDIRAAFKALRTNVFTTMLNMRAKLGEGPDKNHSFHQNVEQGKNMFFSTYYMPGVFEQPENLPYDDNLIRAQTLGTVQSLINVGRKVVLLSSEGTAADAEDDMKAFVDEVQTYLHVDTLSTTVAQELLAEDAASEISVPEGAFDRVMYALHVTKDIPSDKALIDQIGEMLRNNNGGNVEVVLVLERGINMLEPTKTYLQEALEGKPFRVVWNMAGDTFSDTVTKLKGLSDRSFVVALSDQEEQIQAASDTVDRAVAMTNPTLQQLATDGKQINQLAYLVFGCLGDNLFEQADGAAYYRIKDGAPLLEAMSMIPSENIANLINAVASKVAEAVQVIRKLEAIRIAA